MPSRTCEPTTLDPASGRGPSASHLPALPGSYALWLRLPRETVLAVGRFGSHIFPPGDYVYLGSAQGPGGLRARLGRHLRGGSRPHWHIDALRAAAEVCGWWYAAGSERLECRWSRALAALPQARVPLAGFGATDCRMGCPAHLLVFPLGELPAAELEALTLF